MMILMLLCAKTAHTDERTIYQYVDLTAPNVAAGKNKSSKAALETIRADACSRECCRRVQLPLHF